MYLGGNLQYVVEVVVTITLRNSTTMMMMMAAYRAMSARDRKIREELARRHKGQGQENGEAERLPPVRGETVKRFGWDHRLQRQNFFMAFKEVPRW